jgi:hypothetical protein
VEEGHDDEGLEADSVHDVLVRLLRDRQRTGLSIAEVLREAERQILQMFGDTRNGADDGDSCEEEAQDDDDSVVAIPNPTYFEGEPGDIATLPCGENGGENDVVHEGRDGPEESDEAGHDGDGLGKDDHDDAKGDEAGHDEEGHTENDHDAKGDEAGHDEDGHDEKDDHDAKGVEAAHDNEAEMRPHATLMEAYTALEADTAQQETVGPVDMAMEAETANSTLLRLLMDDVVEV